MKVNCKIFHIFDVYLFYDEKQHFTNMCCKQLTYLTSVYKLLKGKFFFLTQNCLPTPKLVTNCDTFIENDKILLILRVYLFNL